MSSRELQQIDRRAEIARQTRKRILVEKDRRIMMALFGIMTYLGVSNLIFGVITLFGGDLAWVDGILMCAFGAMFAYGAFRVWARDDTRWWIVLVPAGSLLILAALLLLSGVLPSPVPTLLCIALLILVALRRKTLAAVRSAENLERETVRRDSDPQV
jgi:hypothetical protein